MHDGFDISDVDSMSHSISTMSHSISISSSQSLMFASSSTEGGIGAEGACGCLVADLSLPGYCWECYYGQTDY